MNENHIKCILMIDDDIDDCTLFRQALREILSDVEFITSDGCRFPNNILSIKPRPDLILLDLNMPGLNGLECMDMIKKDHDFSEIPICVYSTSSDKDQVKLCYERGAKLYIQKPSSYSNIKELVKQLINIDLSCEFNNSLDYPILKV